MDLLDLAKQSGDKLTLSLAASITSPSHQFEAPQKPFIFTHIPRTAGTTLDSICRAVAGAKQVKFARAIGTIYGQFLGSDKIEATEYLDGIKDVHKELKYVVGHVPYGIHTDLGFESATYCVILREPVARLL